MKVAIKLAMVTAIIAMVAFSILAGTEHRTNEKSAHGVKVTAGIYSEEFMAGRYK